MLNNAVNIDGSPLKRPPFFNRVRSPASAVERASGGTCNRCSVNRMSDMKERVEKPRGVRDVDPKTEELLSDSSFAPRSIRRSVSKGGRGT